MATSEQVRRALTVVSNRAVTAVAPLLAAPDPRPVLLVAAVDAVAVFSDGTAALAADHYDELREAARAGGRFTAEPIVNLREERIRRGVLWATAPIYDEAADAALAEERLAQVVQFETARPFRDTITVNRQRDPAAAGWRRNASGSGCKFCRMLADRGAVYKQSTAHFASHPHCSCSASPVFTTDDVGPEASAMQYVASQRTRTPSQRQALRDYLAALPD
jgi:hypothetical protein